MSWLQFWIYMVTILLSPLVALQISEALQVRKERQGRKLWIFRTLMATRATRLSVDHVLAINSIQLEFRGRRERAVLEAWKAYLNHLITYAGEGDALRLWIIRGDDLFIELLHAMAQTLGYEMDKTDLRSTSYFPIGHGRAETDQAEIRLGLLEVLRGRRRLHVTGDPPAPE